jgi:hypothetical protein
MSYPVCMARDTHHLIKGHNMDKNELCEYVRTLSQVLEHNGKGVGLFVDYHDSQIFEEFEDMTLEQITDDVVKVEARCLSLMTADMIKARNEDRKNGL